MRRPRRLYLRLLCIVNGIGGNIYLNLEVIFAAVVVVPFGDAAFCEQDAYQLLERGRCAEVSVECQGAGNKLTLCLDRQGFVIGRGAQLGGEGIQHRVRRGRKRRVCARLIGVGA